MSGAKPPAGRIPLNTLAVAFGLAGLAEAWTAAGDALSFPTAVGSAFWVVVAVAWVWLLAAHVRRGAQVRRPLSQQLADPVQGPIAALVPVVAMLLGTALLPYSRGEGQVVVALAIVAATVFAGWFVGHLQDGGVSVDAVHGGYFLPTVAAGYIGSYAAARCGWDEVAAGAFFLATLGWVVTLGVLLARLASRPPLPPPLVPTLAILVAPPAVGGLAWYAMRGPHMDAVQAGFAGVGVVFFLAQLAFVRRYLALPFTLGFWSFTFPFAAVGEYVIVWLGVLRPAGWQVGVVVLLVLVTALVVGVAARSLVEVARGRIARAERVLQAGDQRALR